MPMGDAANTANQRVTPQVECARTVGCRCPRCDLSALALASGEHWCDERPTRTPQTELVTAAATSPPSGAGLHPSPAMKCTRAMGCRCAQCASSALSMGGGGGGGSAGTGKQPAPAPRRLEGWQERAAYGIDEPVDTGPLPPGCEPPYLLVAHPRPEILGMCYCAIERYLRSHRGWARRYSRDGKTEAWLGTEPWDLLLGGNKAKRVPFKRMGAHRSYAGGRAAVNYCRQFEALDSKDQLAHTLGRYCRRDEAGVELRTLMPETHPYQPGSQHAARQIEAISAAFRRRDDEQHEQQQQPPPPPPLPPKNCWILKNAQLNQGKACVLMETLPDIRSFLEAQTAAGGAWVAQLYVDRPLLYTVRETARAQLTVVGQ
jgi:hypothetical protein